MNGPELLRIVETMHREKNIPKDVIFSVIEAALQLAAQRTAAEEEDVLVHIDRMNQVDYHLQLQRLQAIFERWRPVTILAEANSMGQPLIEQMQRLGLPVRGFTTTNATKAQIVEELALSFEQSRITIPNNPVLIGELEAFGMERLPSGQTRYSAPEGLHDDCVISLCLAHHACNTRPQILQGLY